MPRPAFPVWIFLVFRERRDFCEGIDVVSDKKYIQNTTHHNIAVNRILLRPVFFEPIMRTETSAF